MIGKKPAAGGAARKVKGWEALGRTALAARVHAEAFVRDPKLYLTSLGSRIRGLKVRSHFQFAKIASFTATSYRLWVAREAARPSPPVTSHHLMLIRPIVIAGSGETGAIERTLASLQRAGWTDKDWLTIGPGGGDHALSSWSDLLPQSLGDAEWLLPIAAGDLIAPDAPACYAEVLGSEPQPSLVYADDDLFDDKGSRFHPHFKPDWNPELFEFHDYVSGACIVHGHHLPCSSLSDLTAKAAGDSNAIPRHVARILHHRRSRPEPVRPSPSTAPDLERIVSVEAIIPTRNQSALLAACLESLRRTAYRDLSITIVDNGSDEPEALALLADCRTQGCRVIERPGPFNFSALINAAAAVSQAELLLLLNNDVEEADDSRWLHWLVARAVSPDLGAVGARLLYPDGTIQHAGVIIGMGGGAGHAHRFLHRDAPGYFERAALPQRVTAVTGACLMVGRVKFLAAGGLDEQLFPVAFNDVDLCLRLNAMGWQSFYEPRATLIHHESKSRGSDQLPVNRVRFAGELEALKRRWGTDGFQDPYHNPNLSRYCEQFVVAI